MAFRIRTSRPLRCSRSGVSCSSACAPPSTGEFHTRPPPLDRFIAGFGARPGFLMSLLRVESLPLSPVLATGLPVVFLAPVIRCLSRLVVSCAALSTQPDFPVRCIVCPPFPHEAVRHRRRFNHVPAVFTRPPHRPAA